MKLPRMFTTSSLALLGCSLAAAACHGTQSTPDQPAAAAPSQAAAPAEPKALSASATPAEAPEPTWETMNHDERAHYMKTIVLPAMHAEFAKFDPSEFGDIKCGTCHGAGAKDHTFKMPNPALPKLPTDQEGWKRLEAEDGETVKFMSDVVVPKMAAFLGEKQFDPATKQGFGCFECHTPKK